MPIRYSDSSFSYFDEERKRQEAARLAGISHGSPRDDMEVLTDFLVRRKGSMVLGYANARGIDLTDPLVKDEVLSQAHTIRLIDRLDHGDLSWVNSHFKD